MIFTRKTRLRSLSDRSTLSQTNSEQSMTHYYDLLAVEADNSAVPRDLLRAICWYASGWRQNDITGSILSTPTRLVTNWGCMQLSDHWHPDAFPYAKENNQANIQYAAHLLYWLYQQTGSWRQATVAFFGHDSRAEAADKMVNIYRYKQPWMERITAQSNVVNEQATQAASSDLYADLAF